MADDDRAVRERLAALEAEVKADAEAQRARKEAAMQKLRAQQSEQVELRRRQQELVATKRAPAKRPALLDDDESNLGSALELAGKANRVKNELTKPRSKGEKSWMISGVASMALGPIGWLYAGSLRESIPASVIWVLLATLVTKILPTVLLMPVLMVALPLSGIAGVVYALSYNRTGTRQRLFDKDKDKKQLKSGS